MSQNIPLHLFYGSKRGDLYRGRFVRSICSQGVSALWVKETDKGDARPFKEVKSRYPLDLISVIEDPHLVRFALREGTAGIAIPPSLTESLLQFRDELRRHAIRVYVSCNGDDYRKDDYRFVQSDHLSRVFYDISHSIEALRKGGLSDISVQFSHPDAVVNFKINKLLKERFRSHHVVSFVPYPSRVRSVLANSLDVGALFYEQIGNSLLIRPEPSGVLRRRHVDTAIELSKKILASLDLAPSRYKIISCPTCGRCQMNLPEVAEEVERSLKKIEKRYRREGRNLEDVGGIVVAVMGCNVNGPGEARNADIGIAGGKNKRGIIFKNGEPIETLPEHRLVDHLVVHVTDIIEQKFLALG